MQLEFGYDTIWICLRIFSLRCNWNLDTIQFGFVFDLFRWGAIGIWLWHNLELSWNNFYGTQLKFGQDTIWNCRRMFSMRSNWNLAAIKIGFVLEYFRWGAIGIWLRLNLDLSSIFSDEVQLELDYERNWNSLRIISMIFNWNLARTSGSLLEYFRWGAFETWLRRNLKLS